MTNERWIINDRAYFAKTDKMGLGVFAAREIFAEEKILIDPVRSFEGLDAERIRNTNAYHILFVDRQKYTENSSGFPLHFVIGPISIINHCKESNCFIRWNLEPAGIESSAILIAKRKIYSGEELFITYYNIEEYDFD